MEPELKGPRAMPSHASPMEYDIDVDRLAEVGKLIAQNIHVVIDQRSKDSKCTEGGLPPWSIYEARRNIISATGVLVELVSDPALRLMEYSGQYWESRALAIAVAKRIPDVLSSGPLPLSQLSNITQIESAKLARVLRCLCSSHIFSEPEPAVFANNRISCSLVQNEPLTAYILMFHADLFSCAEHLPRTLFDEKFGPSYDVRQTAFQKALCTDKSRWEWLEESPSHDEKRLETSRTNYPGIPGYQRPRGNHGISERHRPELALFSMAMVGGGRVTTQAHLYDYPWQELERATIVDVGGGVGGFMIELSRRFPLLEFVIQDCSANLELAETQVWPKENEEALSQGRVKFMTHDFFTPNPVTGADIYWLRYILHDWDDTKCVQILSAIREAMSPGSRILICEQVMDTTTKVPSTLIESPLPSNFGVYKRYSHQRDLDVMAIINGIERTPAEFQSLFASAGLIMKKIWPCRSQVSIIEVLRQ